MCEASRAGEAAAAAAARAQAEAEAAAAAAEARAEATAAVLQSCRAELQSVREGAEVEAAMLRGQAPQP